MAGIQLSVFAGAAANNFTATWPPGDTSLLTVIFGTAALTTGSPPPDVGTLQITNTNGTDFAAVYLNSTPANILTSEQTTLVPLTTGSTGASGLFCRATLQTPPPGRTIDNGYSFDFATPELRLIRWDSSVPTIISTLDLTGFDGGYYTNTANPRTFHMSDAGSGQLVKGWCSAVGQTDTGNVSATGAATTSHASGRIGFVMFQNLPGAGTGVFSTYQASWTI